jgi:hypothetical protein
MNQVPALSADVMHDVAGIRIGQRASDGYFDATAMCRAHGKQFNDYRRIQQTAEFLDALSSKTGIPVFDLVQSIQGPHGGTWVHHRVAINLAQWCSPQFAVDVTEWVENWLTSGKARPSADCHLISQFIRELGPYHQAGIREGLRLGMGVVLPKVEQIDHKSDTALNLATQAFEVSRSYGGRIEALEREKEKKNKRKNLKPYDKYLMRLTVARRFNGYCPVRGPCCLGQIVDADGEMLYDDDEQPLAEYDHHYHVGNPDIRQSLIACRNCHADRTAQRRDDPRHVIQSEFEAFQKQLEIVMREEQTPLFAGTNITVFRR